MARPAASLWRTVAIWGLLAVVLVVPLVAAAGSPLLAWRDPIYIAASFAGVLALAVLVCQPLLAGGDLPRLSRPAGRLVHRVLGAAVVGLVLVHLIGLWLTSPPDVVDALLLRSPTPFSVWGVVAMWAVFAAALMATLRRRLRLHPVTWRRVHTALAAVIVSATVIHALLIEGTMEPVTKIAVSIAALAGAAMALWRVWRRVR
ncbi:ferric reductase-like transmembrane domain-containing protein [uncultured Tateyamaria sp.]|uniref:ferric reductase-like transmembrane domain-containing protein n=1 Tax=uncultured Tateyamaria sp. TaxID=455651 RepID=UPI00260F752B|nr:ferric reductase-like transmembrane domain-containing protein [uncultured Tateyamaria sp.]